VSSDGSARVEGGAQVDSSTLTAALTLEPVEPARFDLAFTARTQDCPWPKAYGGDLVAQAGAAAIRSVGDDRQLNSMHSYFLRPAEIGATLTYEVEILRDGRGYSTRQVRAYQAGRVIYLALASFAVGEAGGSWKAVAPEGIPGPQDLPDTAGSLAGRGGSPEADRALAYWSGGRSFDLRHVPDPIYLDADPECTPHQAVWVRPFDALRPVPGLNAAQRDTLALAYVCDYTILEPVLRTLGLAWATQNLVTASLDHAMWFHRSPPAGALDGWLLYVQETLAADAGRGAGLGRFFTPDHLHLATVVQEGAIRRTVYDSKQEGR